MRFAFDEARSMFRDAIRGALRREAPLSRIRGWTGHGDGADGLGEFDRIASREGWTGVGIPESAGGQGGGMVELALFFEELGRAAAPSGRLLAATGLALPLLQRAAGDLRAVGDALAEGTGVALVVDAGRPVDGSRPVDSGRTGIAISGGRATGAVRLVLDAPGARHLLVPMRAGDAWELWRVSGDAPGVSIVTRRMVDRTRRFGDVRLEGVAAAHVGTCGSSELAAAAARVAVLAAAESLGLARGMLDMTTAYVKQRVQFGVPVGSFQAVKHSAAEALTDIEAAHSGVYHAAWALDDGAGDAPTHAWIAKAFATAAAARVADKALFLHGAIGYTWEYDLQFYFKRAKANEMLFGSPAEYRERIAAGLPLLPGQA